MAVAWCAPPAQEAAAGFLHPSEREELARIRSPRRAGEWLAARVAVKLLVVDVFELGDPRSWRVEKDPCGVPRLVLDRSAGSAVLPCSLSHSGGLALAGLSPEAAWDLGVDIQRVRPQLTSLRHCFTGRDDRLGEPLPLGWAETFLWACKEAAAKALGLGMALDFRTLKVTGTKAGSFRVGCPGFGEWEGRFFPLVPTWAAAVCFRARS